MPYLSPFSMLCTQRSRTVITISRSAAEREIVITVLEDWRRQQTYRGA